MKKLIWFALFLFLGSSFAAFCFQENATTNFDGCGLSGGRYNFTTGNWAFPTPVGDEFNLNDSNYTTGIGTACGTQSSMIVEVRKSSSFIPTVWQVKNATALFVNVTLPPNCTNALSDKVILNLSMNETGACAGATTYMDLFCYDNVTWYPIYKGGGNGDVVYEEGIWLNMTTSPGNPPLISACNLIYTYKVANFSIFDEINRSFLLANSRITAFLSHPLSLLPITTNYSANYSNKQNFSICALTNASGFYLSSIEQYDDNGTFQYNQRNYYIKNESVKDIEQNYSRYLGTLAETNLVNFVALNQLGLGLGNATISAYRYYPAENMYLLVAQALTGSDGTANMWLTYADALYRFTIREDSGVITTFPDQTIGCQVGFTCLLTLSVTSETQGEYLQYTPTLTKSCALNNATSILTCSVNDPTGLLSLINLTVYNDSINGSNIVGTNWTTGSSGTLTLYLGNMNGKVFIARLTGHFNQPNMPIETDVYDFKHGPSYGILGLFIGLLLVITTTSIGAIGGPSGAVAGAWLGFAISATLSLISVSILAVMGLGILVAVLIHIMK